MQVRHAFRCGAYFFRQMRVVRPANDKKFASLTHVARELAHCSHECVLTFARLDRSEQEKPHAFFFALNSIHRNWDIGNPIRPK